jgi:hypothetical protein
MNDDYHIVDRSSLRLMLILLGSDCIVNVDVHVNLIECLHDGMM